MTKSWPTFSSSDIPEMRERSFLSSTAAACAGAPTARAAVTPAVAARTVRREGGRLEAEGLEGPCAPSGESTEGNFQEVTNIREVSASQGKAHGRDVTAGPGRGAPAFRANSGREIRSTGQGGRGRLPM